MTNSREPDTDAGKFVPVLAVQSGSALAAAELRIDHKLPVADSLVVPTASAATTQRFGRRTRTSRDWTACVISRSLNTVNWGTLPCFIKSRTYGISRY